jgi:hypothetical protein
MSGQGKRNRLILLGGILFTVGVVSISALYLPYSSMNTADDEEMRELNEKFRTKAQMKKANSMWKNMDTNSKSNE